MIKRVFLSLLMVSSFWSCTNDDPCDTCEMEDAGKVDVTFQFKTATTKGLGTPPNATACDSITNFQIFVFDEMGLLENTKFYEAEGKTAVSMKVVPGIKDFYAVANYDKMITGISEKEDLASLVSNLTDDLNQKPRFLMVAQLFNKEIEDLRDDHHKNDVYLEAERLVSRVQVRYKLDFSKSNYKDKEFYVDSVYLLNANTKCTFTYTQAGGKVVASEPADGLNNFRNPFMESLCETGRWDKQEDTDHFYPGPTAYDWFYFYTFPNQPEDLDKATMIVISAMLDGTRTYYPIIVNHDKTGISYEGGGKPSHSMVKNNALYLITATIKGRGSDEPEIPVEYVDLSVNVSVKQWSDITQETDFSSQNK